jgi:hypothetical protein
MYVKVGGNAIQRCDAKCYDAKAQKCTCCCGGKNHAVGFQQAVDNVKEQFGPVVDVMLEFGGMELTTK